MKARPLHRLALSVPLGLLACGASLNEVPRGPHPPLGGAIPVVVEEEPPPPVIEMVGEPPDGECLWADGSWSHGADGFTWVPGGWVRLREDCYYADATLVWVPAVNQPGALFFTPGRWYRTADGLRCAPPEECRPE